MHTTSFALRLKFLYREKFLQQISSLNHEAFCCCEFSGQWNKSTSTHTCTANAEPRSQTKQTLEQHVVGVSVSLLIARQRNGIHLRFHRFTFALAKTKFAALVWASCPCRFSERGHTVPFPNRGHVRLRDINKRRLTLWQHSEQSLCKSGLKISPDPIRTKIASTLLTRGNPVQIIGSEIGHSWASPCLEEGHSCILAQYDFLLTLFLCKTCAENMIVSQWICCGSTCRQLRWSCKRLVWKK